MQAAFGRISLATSFVFCLGFMCTFVIRSHSPSPASPYPASFHLNKVYLSKRIIYIKDFHLLLLWPAIFFAFISLLCVLAFPFAAASAN